MAWTTAAADPAASLYHNDYLDLGRVVHWQLEPPDAFEGRRSPAGRWNVSTLRATFTRAILKPR